MVGNRRNRVPRKQRLLALGGAVSLAVLLGMFAVHDASGSDGHAPTASVTRVPSGGSSPSRPTHPLVAAPMPSATPSPASPMAVASNPLLVYALRERFPQSGPGTFRYASGTGPVLGTSGPVHRFRVAIESNIKVVGMAAFIAKIDATLGDARSWVAGRRTRLEQVAGDSSSEFTIYLATPQTTNRLCAPLRSGGYTSCRQGPKVVLNLARWMTSVRYYTNAKVVLDTYRTYMINHEVGHALGHDHELCPGTGKAAPVMQQQTFGLHGCRPNAWPFVHGKRYDGPPGRY